VRGERYKEGKKKQERDCKRSEAIAAYSETGSESMLANQVTRGSDASTASGVKSETAQQQMKLG